MFVCTYGVLYRLGEYSHRDRLCTVCAFYALRGMHTRSSAENSVRLSVKRVIPDKMEERWVHIFISYERSFSLVF